MFGEMVTILDQIRNKYKNTKFIISEITPRNDNRDNEVKCFNSVTFNTFQTPRNKSYHQMRNSEPSMQNISSSHTNASNGPIDTRFRNLAGYDSNKTYSSRVKSNEYPCNANNLMSWVWQISNQYPYISIARRHGRMFLLDYIHS